jgi:hypothetical protein
MTRYLRYGSLAALLLFAACSSNPYKHIATASVHDNSVLTCKPQFTRELYRCVVDGRFLIKKFHLSGILLFKKFEDGSTRAVFQNEMGIAFFDFKWDARDSFSVASIMSQLNKPAVIKTLRTDISLLLMKGLNPAAEQELKWDGRNVSRFPVNSGYAYYTREKGSISLIEYAGKSLITSISLKSDKPATMPESALVKHHKAHFTIDLKKLPQDDN